MKPAVRSLRPSLFEMRGLEVSSDEQKDSLRHFTASLRKRGKRYRKGLKRCQKKFSEKAIHTSRVETRRLLAMAELLGAFISPEHREKVERALKRHLDTFDELRDTQVQLQTVGKLLRLFPAARPLQSCLVKREEHLGRKTRRNIRRLGTRPVAKAIAVCRAEVKRRLADVGSRAAAAILLRSVDRAFERTRRLRAQIKPGEPQSIHRTRVAFKRFRYMIECLADYLPGMNDEYLEAMHQYQAMMGEIQDAQVLLETLDKFLRKKEIRPSAARRFREELLRRRQWLVRVYLDAAGQLNDFWPLTSR